MGGGIARHWVESLLGVFFPKVCMACGATLIKGETVICLGCDASLPRIASSNFTSNLVTKRLYGDHTGHRAAALFSYVPDTPHALLIKKAKYSGMWRLARDMGAMMAQDFLPRGFFDGVDVIVPVPVSPARRVKRGYNQSLMIAQGISAVTGIPVSDCLTAKAHGSQTRLTPYQRYANAQGIYSASAEADLCGKHALIVDDVITTGSTVLACAAAIRAAFPTATVSIAALGLTRGNFQSSIAKR